MNMNLEKIVSKQEKGMAGFAINNPHFILVCCLAILIMGLLSLVLLPKDLLPSVNSPAVQILSFYNGMPVEHVEQNLSARFERYTGQAIGIQRQESKSLVGVSIVRNFFGEDTDLNTAISQTTSLVMSVLRRLPPGTQPPLILPFDPTASVPLALVAVSGDFPEKVLYDTARYDVGNTIQAVPGAMAPTVMGGAERQIVVFADPKKLDNYNFSLLDVIDRVTQLNTFIPTGDVKIGKLDYQILSNGLVDKIPEMNDFPLRSYNGVPVYIKDIGEAKDSHKIQTNIVMVDGKRQVYVPVYRQPGANSIKVVDDIKINLKKLGIKLKGFSLNLVADQSIFIRHAIESITEEAVIGGSLAALMVFLFLGNPRATLGVVLSLPLSLLCAFIGLRAFGQTINAMTLGGLALSIGVLVDNSIVVLENISKKIEAGMTPRQAAIIGSSEVSLPVLSATISTMVVFFPVVFLTGIVKVLFSAVAKSVIFAMIGSFFAAMCVMPLFASKILKSDVKLPRLLLKTKSWIDTLTELYGRTLERALVKRKIILTSVVTVGLVILCFAPFIGTELFPRSDAGNFNIDLRLKSGTRIEETEIFSKSMEAKLREWIPKEDLKMIIINAGVYYGFPAAFTPNSGPQDVFFNVELTEDRHHTSQYYAKVIREHLAKEFPDVESGFELGGLLSSALNNGLKSPINIEIEGSELKKSYEIATDLLPKIKKLRGAVDVRIQQRFDAPQIVMNVDRKKSMSMGLTTDEVMKNVVSAVSGSSSYNTAIWVDPKSGIDYLLGVQFPESEMSSIADLGKIPITGKNQERTVSLGKIATLTQSLGPGEINHVNLAPVIDIYLDAQGRDIGAISREILGLIKGSHLPEGYSADVRGEYADMIKAVSSLGGGFLLAAILVYLILVAQFRSFVLPLIIMATVPLGLVGIVVMFLATKTYFSIQAAIGAIFMIGIAVANGVLLIEFIGHSWASHKHTLNGAILDGAKARLRPILMTSLASMFGLVPMALGLGKGSEANVPLGRAVIGGQFFSTILTLFIVPILFSYLAPLISKKKS